MERQRQIIHPGGAGGSACEAFIYGPLVLALLFSSTAYPFESKSPKQLGREVSIARHLADDEEFRIPLPDLLAHGRNLFIANWTDEEGGGRPQMKGNGRALS